MEKTEDLIYVDLPTVNIVLVAQKISDLSCQVETICKDCFAGDSPFANICQIAQGKTMQDS